MKRTLSECQVGHGRDKGLLVKLLHGLKELWFFLLRNVPHVFDKLCDVRNLCMVVKVPGHPRNLCSTCAPGESHVPSQTPTTCCCVRLCTRFNGTTSTFCGTTQPTSTSCTLSMTSSVDLKHDGVSLTTWSTGTPRTPWMISSVTSGTAIHQLFQEFEVLEHSGHSQRSLTLLCCCCVVVLLCVLFVVFGETTSLSSSSSPVASCTSFCILPSSSWMSWTQTTHCRWGSGSPGQQELLHIFWTRSSCAVVSFVNSGQQSLRAKLASLSKSALLLQQSFQETDRKSLYRRHALNLSCHYCRLGWTCRLLWRLIRMVSERALRNWDPASTKLPISANFFKI